MLLGVQESYRLHRVVYDFAYTLFAYEDRGQMKISIDVSLIVNPIWFHRTWLTYG